jgi:hypothetical protein
MSDGLSGWLASVSGPQWRWFLKILAGNDTLLNKSHQAGLYIPKPVIFDLFPAVAASAEANPRQSFPVYVDSHGDFTVATAIWYNNRTRNEARITGWGGKKSPLLDPDATGSLCVLAFRREGVGDADSARVWLCSSVEEEDLILDRTGPVEPGEGVYYDPSRFEKASFVAPQKDLPCWITAEELPEEWRYHFPEATEIVSRAVRNLPSAALLSADKRLVRRRDCEFEIFRSIEEFLVLPRIKEGFATVDLFVNFANSVTNRRKSRGGVSLELHAKAVFDEENLSYSYDQISEERKRPDFLFPSADAYHSRTFPAEKLQMLGVKTTCKDRWRQIITEADRISHKYLLTLQEGVSPNQFAAMTAEKVALVVPSTIQSRYAESIRPHLVSFQQFIELTKAKCQ